jgi:hypothetical protein
VIGHEEADAFRRVAWRVQDLYMGIPELDRVAIVERRERVQYVSAVV